MVEDDHLAKTNRPLRSVFRRYRRAILEFGDDIVVDPTYESYIAFSFNRPRSNASRRIANFSIGRSCFLIWLNIRPGTISDPSGLTWETGNGHTITIKDERNFDKVVLLLKQAYLRNK
jgi:predicted transport protein